MDEQPIPGRTTDAVPAIAVAGCLSVIAVMVGYWIDSEYARCAGHASGEVGFWCGLTSLVETVAAALLLAVPFPGVVGVLALRGGRRDLAYALATVPGVLLAAQVLALAAAFGADPPAVRAGILGLATAGLGLAAVAATESTYRSSPGGRPVAGALVGSGVMLLGALVLFGLLRS